MGCLTRVGCLAVLVLGGAGAWWAYGDRLPAELTHAAQRAKRLVLAPAPDPAPAGNTVGTPSADKPRNDWVAIPTGIENGAASSVVRNKLAGLARRSGPAYATVNATELADLLALPITRSLPATASGAEIALRDDQLLVRADVDRRDFAASNAVGALIGSALGGRDTVQLGGTLEVLRPGLLAFRVRSLQLRGLDLPTRLIPSIISVVRQHARNAAQTQAAAHLPDDALALVISPAIADVRLRGSRLTLYRAVP